MNREIEIFIDKLYRYDRILEPCYIGFPLEKGLVYDTADFSLIDPDKATVLPTQIKATSKYKDGSIRFIFIRFLADIPANKKSRYICKICSKDEVSESSLAPFSYNPISLKELSAGYEISTKDNDSKEVFSFEVKNNAGEIFNLITKGKRTYEGKQFAGPILKTAKNAGESTIKTGNWEVVENGSLCVILKNKGQHINKLTGEMISFEIKLSAFAGKPYTEVSYRIINDTNEPMEIESLRYHIFRTAENCSYIDPEKSSILSSETNALEATDSTGCGDHLTASEFGEGPLYHVSNSQDADKLSPNISLSNVRTLAAYSNYKTDYIIGRNGVCAKRIIDSDKLMKEANEHFSEVFYGTFFADCTDEEGGICATIYQAQQNYPKAIQADSNGITLFIVPENVEKIILQSGMSREQKFLLHFHDASESITSLNDRSIVYQMPYRPYVLPEVQKQSGVWPDIFTSQINTKVEQNLIARADGHNRAYGMLNFGDSYDANYTAQGRGGGKLVWCNNEYDYPHACALLYARTGIRRFLDYNIASASHWMDVDVCHYHENPLYIGGQWEHTAGHVINGVMVCSHEWVEGLLDYYHFTGDERGLETAIGIGENVMKLLDMPMYAKAGEANARETGWALRTLTALYIETSDKKWLTKCEKILDDFKIWEKQYGHWLAPYTDNTIIRVGFMISVAIGSLMRYYREFPDEELKGLILRAVDDMIENCYEESIGLFYYKELPSLNRLGTNTLLLESLTIAYDLTGDTRYLEYGIGTFRNAVSDAPSYSSTKRKEENAVLVGNVSSKNFAQSLIPISGFYRALAEADMLKQL